MSTRSLIRWGGLAAILAGVLRAIASFVPSSNPSAALEVLYLVIDLCLLFGILGVYTFQHLEAGVLGFLGFVLGAAGAAIIAGPDGEIGGLNMFIVGGLFTTIGLISLAIASWTANKLPRWASALWAISTGVGLAGFFAESLSVLFVIGGLGFGVGFARAGITLWSGAGETAP